MSVVIMTPTTTTTTPSKGTIMTTTNTSTTTNPTNTTLLVSPGSTTNVNHYTTTTSNNNNNSNETLLLLSLETMNEQLRNLLSKEHVQVLLLKVQERSLFMEQLTFQQQQQIQVVLQFIQQQQQQQQEIQRNNNNNSDNNDTIPNDVDNVKTQISSQSSSLSSNHHHLNVTLQQHQIRRRTLIQHTATSLLELLELPNLMDACIKSSQQQQQSSSTSSLLLEPSNTMNHMNMNNNDYYYDEAIQIAAFANTLERRHGTTTTTTTTTTHTTPPTAHSSSTEGSLPVDGTATTTTPTTTNMNHPTLNHSNNNVSIIHQVIAQIRLRQEELRQHLLLRLQQQQPHQPSSSSSCMVGGLTTTSTTTTTTMMMNECLEIITALRRLNAIDLERMTQSYNTKSGSGGGNTNTNDETTTTSVMNMEQLHAVSEYQLQIAFLEARDAWLDRRSDNNNNITHNPKNRNTMIRPIPTTTSSSTESILDLIERYRTRMFEIATQYNAIFTSTSTTTTSSSSSATNNTTTTTSAQQLLSLWITRRIQYFLQILRHELTMSTTNAVTNATSTNNSSHTTTTTNNHTSSAIDTAMVRDAIEASVFFATSLGRLGGDFTCQLVSIFEPIVIQIITQQYWNHGIQQFHHTLEICRDAGIAGPLSTTIPTTTTSLDEGDTNKYDELPQTNVPPLDEPQPPPKRLLTLPPLARFVNAILTGLNELRRCLLPGIFVPLRQYMKTNVIDVMKQELELNERMVLTPGLRGDAMALRLIAVQMKDTFHTIVEPYILGSLEAAIGYKDGAIQYHTQLYANIQKLQEEQEQQRRSAELEIEGVEDVDSTNIEPQPNDSIALSTTGIDNEDVVHDDSVVGVVNDDDNVDAAHITTNSNNETLAVSAATEMTIDEEEQQQD